MPMSDPAKAWRGMYYLLYCIIYNQFKPLGVYFRLGPNSSGNKTALYIFVHKHYNEILYASMQ